MNLPWYHNIKLSFWSSYCNVKAVSRSRHRSASWHSDSEILLKFIQFGFLGKDGFLLAIPRWASMWLFNVNVREHLAHYALLPFQMPAKHEMSWKLCRSIQFCNFWQIHSVKFTPSLPGLCQHGHNFLSRTWYTCIPADCAASWIHSKLQLN